MFNFKNEKKIVVITSKFNLMNGERNSAYQSTEEKRLEEDWLRKRIDIFMNFLLKALVGQSNQSFIALYAYQDETEELIKNILAEYYHQQFTFYTIIYRLQQGVDKYKSFELEPFDLL